MNPHTETRVFKYPSFQFVAGLVLISLVLSPIGFVLSAGLLTVEAITAWGNNYPRSNGYAWSDGYTCSKGYAWSGAVVPTHPWVSQKQAWK